MLCYNIRMICFGCCNFSTLRIPIISNHTHRSQNPDDRYDDQELDEGEGFTVHNKILSKTSRTDDCFISFVSSLYLVLEMFLVNLYVVYFL